METGYKIMIGDKLDYVEYGSDDRIPVIVTDILFDGFVFFIYFRYDDILRYGVTEYPDKLKQKIKLRNDV